MQSIKFESKINTAECKIICLRCQAHSKRTKLQCGKPTLEGKKVCQFHGGRSTGPKSEAGKTRQKASFTKSGNFTKESSEARASSMRMLHGLEDAMYVLEMTDAPRTRGPKPKNYKPLATLADINRFILDNPLHLPEAFAEHQK